MNKIAADILQTLLVQEKDPFYNNIKAIFRLKCTGTTLETSHSLEVKL